jgi:hypothetical protein
MFWLLSQFLFFYKLETLPEFRIDSFEFPPVYAQRVLGQHSDSKRSTFPFLMCGLQRLRMADLHPMCIDLHNVKKHVMTIQE